MDLNGTPVEVLDAQVIFHPREVLPDFDLTQEQREAIAVEMCVLAMESAGVDGALWHGERGVAEAAVTRYPDRFRAMVHYRPDEVSDVKRELETLRDTPGLVGIRLSPAWPPTEEKIHGGPCEPWFSECERLDIPLSLFISGHLKEMPEIAEAHPGLRILVDHIGMYPPPFAELVPELLDPVPDLLVLARYDNVAVKFTGLPALSFEPYPFSDLWPIGRQIFDAFGPERLMWGSDFRRLRTLHPYAEVVDFLRFTDEVSEADKRLMFSTSLRKWVDWDRT